MIYDLRFRALRLDEARSYEIWRYDKGGTEFRGWAPGNIPHEVVSTGGAGYVSMGGDEYYLESTCYIGRGHMDNVFEWKSYFSRTAYSSLAIFERSENCAGNVRYKTH